MDKLLERKDELVSNCQVTVALLYEGWAETTEEERKILTKALKHGNWQVPTHRLEKKAPIVMETLRRAAAAARGKGRGGERKSPEREDAQR